MRIGGRTLPVSDGPHALTRACEKAAAGGRPLHWVDTY